VPDADLTGKLPRGAPTLRWQQPIYKDGVMRPGFRNAMLKSGQAARSIAVQNTSPIMADDEEAVEHGEGDRGNREEIHRRDGFPMVTKKSE